MSFLKALQEVKALLRLFCQDGGVQGPGEVNGDMDIKESKAWHVLHYSSVDVDGGVCVAPSSPEVHNDLFGVLGVKVQVVSTPRGQVLDLIPVGRLVIPSDQAYHSGVVCKLGYGVRTM